MNRVLELLATGTAATLLLAFGKPLLDRMLGRRDRLLGQRRARVDTAEVVQGMALDLLTPLEKRLKDAEIEVDELRRKISALMEEVDQAVAARRKAEAARLRAEDALLRAGIPIPIMRET